MKTLETGSEGFAERKTDASRIDGFAERKPIILCADDFAVHAAASRGIAQLAQQARLSATSVMVLSPRWRLDVVLLQELRGRIDVGLHLDWTSEFAVAAGHGASLNAALFKALLGGFHVAKARSVIERQLDAFEAQWKAPPDYVDGHQHVQQFDGIRQALVQALSARYGAQPPYLRVSQAPRGVAGLKGRIISAMGAHALRELAAQAAIPCAARLSGIYDFSGDGARYAALMKQWLALAAEGDIVMCHPALSAQAGDAIGPARRWEYDYLSSPEFAAALAQHQVQLVRGAACFKRSVSA